MLAEGSTERQVALPLTSEGVIRLTPRLRETYLTEDVDHAIVQAAGYHLYIWVWSDNRSIRLAIPLDGWRSERVYERSIHRWGINLNRWTTPGKHADPDEDLGWWNNGKIVTGYGGKSNKEMVDVTVRVVEGAKPDV